MDKVLIVDDEKNYPTILGEVIREDGFEPVAASSGLMALDILRNEPIDLVLTDVMMPGIDGIELLAQIKELNPTLPVMVMTAHGSVERAVEAMEKGAFTYILKPFDNDTLVAHIKKAIAIHEIVKENSRLKEEISIRYNFDNIIGKSKPMEELYNVIRKVAPTSASILIEGESGTGKELAARSIHYNSTKKDHPLVAVNCSAFPKGILQRRNNSPTPGDDPFLWCCSG